MSWNSNVAKKIRFVKNEAKMIPNLSAFHQWPVLCKICFSQYILTGNENIDPVEPLSNIPKMLFRLRQHGMTKTLLDI